MISLSVCQQVFLFLVQKHPVNFSLSNPPVFSCQLHCLFPVYALAFIILHMFLNRHLFPLQNCLFPFFLRALPLNDQHVFPSRFILLMKSYGFFQSCGHYRFKFLCQFTAYCHFPVSQYIQQLPQCFPQMVRSLINNYRPAFLYQLLQHSLPFLLIRWQKTFKAKPSCTQS